MHRLPSAVLAALLLAACGQPGPTWHGDIAPIIERSCSGCHAFDERTAPRQAQRMAVTVSGSARCECEWDNGTARGTPQRVLFGLGKSDNMCVCSLELANDPL